MTILPIPSGFRTFTAPVLAQTLQPQASSQGSSNFVTAHWEAIAIGASLVAAGIGAGILLWKRRRPPTPSDGVPRTESQRTTLEQALQFEKNLTSPDGKIRHKSVLGLMNLLLRLSPEDRPERIRRIAAQLCLDWPGINKDRPLGDEIKNRIPRLLRPLLEQLTAEIAKRTDAHAAVNIRTNAEAILRWIRGGK